MGLATHDDTRWPVVVVRMPAGFMTNEEFDAHLRRLAHYLERSEPHALVIDIGENDLVGENRRQLADYHRLHASAVREHLRGVAMVVRAPIHRAMYHAIDALLEAPYPFSSFATVDAAVAWASQMVTKRPSKRPVG